MTYTNLPRTRSRAALAGRRPPARLRGRPLRAQPHLGPRDRARTGEPDKDAVIFNLRDGRVALIHRIHPNMQLALFDSLDELWEPPARLLGRAHARARPAHDHRARAGRARRRRRRAAGRDRGRASCSSSTSATATAHYTTRVALLDAETGRVESLLPEPIMRPELPWERRGDVDNVVFVQGAVVQPDGDIYLTYGAADRHVGAATVGCESLLAALRAA